MSRMLSDTDLNEDQQDCVDTIRHPRFILVSERVEKERGEREQDKEVRRRECKGGLCNEKGE
jgi:hypothetical protein